MTPAVIDQSGQSILVLATPNPLATTSYSPAQLATLHQNGFVPASSQAPQRLVINLAGLEKTGKTHLALTGRQPVFIFSVDVGTEGVVEKFVRQGIEVWEYKIHVERAVADGNEQVMWDHWKAQWLDLKTKLWAAYQMNPGTVIIDTWGECYELARLAHFGKQGAMPNQYGVVYTDLRAMVRWSYDSPTATTIFIHKMGIKFNTVDQLEVKGFSDMDYLVQLNLRNGRTDAETPGTMPKFMTWIKDCRQNPLCNGFTLDGDQFNIQYLEWFVHQWKP